MYGPKSFAKRYYPDGDILGHTLKIRTLKDEPPYTPAPGQRRIGSGGLVQCGFVFECIVERGGSAGVSVGSGLLNRLITRWVENSALDPWLTVGVSGVLLAVAGLACLLPSSVLVRSHDGIAVRIRRKGLLDERSLGLGQGRNYFRCCFPAGLLGKR